MRKKIWHRVWFRLREECEISGLAGPRDLHRQVPPAAHPPECARRPRAHQRALQPAPREHLGPISADDRAYRLLRDGRRHRRQPGRHRRAAECARHHPGPGAVLRRKAADFVKNPQAGPEFLARPPRGPGRPCSKPLDLEPRRGRRGSMNYPDLVHQPRRA